MRRIACIFVWFFASGWGVANPPVLDWLHPVGVQSGEHTTVLAGGKLTPWPPKVWCEHEGIVFSTNGTASSWTVAVATNVPPGAYWVRAWNEEGASDARLLRVSALPHLLEVEPNNAIEEALTVTSMPVVVNGRLQKNGDVDLVRLSLKKGQLLSARVSCHQLDAPLDPLLTLIDDKGFTLGFNHDGMSLDPLLLYTADRDREVLLQLSGFKYPPASSVSFSGAEAAVYQLELRNKNPIGLPADFAARTDTNLFLDGPHDAHIKAGAARVLHFHSAKGDARRFTLQAAVFGTSVDTVLEVLDAKGKVLGTADDAGKQLPDPTLEWSAKADGFYQLRVSDRLKQGGPDHPFRVVTQRLNPDWSARCAAQRVALPPDSETSLSFETKRHQGFAGTVHLIALGLPEGVTATSPEIPAKGGSVSLTLITEAKAPPFQGSIRFAAIAVDASNLGRREVPVEIKPRTTPLEDMIRSDLDHLWLTITKPKPATDTEKK